MRHEGQPQPIQAYSDACGTALWNIRETQSCRLCCKRHWRASRVPKRRLRPTGGSVATRAGNVGNEQLGGSGPAESECIFAHLRAVKLECSTGGLCQVFIQNATHPASDDVEWPRNWIGSHRNP